MTKQQVDLSEFRGSWNIYRSIEDRLLDRIGHLKGTADFIPDGPAFVYSEQGELTFAGQPALSTRRDYLWRADGAAVLVLFADGKPFHRFLLSGSTAEASYWCDPDQYRVLYEFSDWPNWTTTWSVKGPRKDYLSVTRFERSGDMER